MFNDEELEKVKAKALDEHIPIIMDDTLDVIKGILEKESPKCILEIGTAVGYSAICFTNFLATNGRIDTIEREKDRVEEAKINIDREVAFLFIHGLLHLLGYDHETSQEDEEEMFAIQEKILKKLVDYGTVS